ncbi:DHH phosphoesterase [Aspergillus campestris IBT 28561]|uniref:DHH phosphoesterase n=1 Tax=Aspergillus campestris (strain IBT 28561) TaxID=1392248 RepID=A0A2I1D1Y2_ASPC2|nr:DHH phosphoesterase [Aspergillus campestris IBT 28561]PKY03884.1 DHH phosphoesterase [Aspergillus campestris IBT 28561]
MPPSLLKTLRTALQTHHRFITGALSHAEPPIYVIGNPSADLDSIISAVVYAYFGNLTARQHIPLINLPNVPSGPELYRLRPEFVKALHLSTHPALDGEQAWDETPESAGALLRDHFLTVADFAAQLKINPGSTSGRLQADAVLVDWNALPMASPSAAQQQQQHPKGCIPGLETAVDFTVLGCVDHHIDEGFLPRGPQIKPLEIHTAGSCASLVAHTLQSLNLWRDNPPLNDPQTQQQQQQQAQLALLALSAILIDTTNLTSKDKVTPWDTHAVEFLTRQLSPNNKNTTNLYNQVHQTKQNSLNLLTVNEILDRDYKQWTETPSSSNPSPNSKPVEIGFCSMVKSLPWIIRKAGNARSFLDAVEGFARARDLGIVVVMTAFSSPVKGGEFTRELFVVALEGGRHTTNINGNNDDVATTALKHFVDQAEEKLSLQPWAALDVVDRQDQEEEIARSLCGNTNINKQMGSTPHFLFTSNVSQLPRHVYPFYSPGSQVQLSEMKSSKEKEDNAI